MIETTDEVVVSATADEVWSVLADFGGISRWAPNVDHSCLTTSAGTGVGAVRRVQMGRNVLLESVVEWVPAKRLSYSLAGLPPVLKSAINTWDLAESNGSTTVTLTSAVDAGPRPPQKLIAKAATRMLAKASAQMLGGLAAHVTGERRYVQEDAS